jgi:DNA-binding transcriptional LysR family regulator
MLIFLCSAHRIDVLKLVHRLVPVDGADCNQYDCPVMHESLFARSGLSLDRLKTFIEIVAAGGINSGAKGDPNRQSQFSRQLRELEGFFETELVLRGRGPMRLTPAGRRLHEIANHTFTTLTELQNECAKQPVELRIGAGESLIHWLLLPKLSQIMELEPRAQYTFSNLRNDEIVDGVFQGDLDLGLVSRGTLNRQIASIPLGKLRYSLCVPQGLRGKKSRVRRFPLEGLPLAGLGESPGSQAWELLEKCARKNRCTLDLRARFSSYPALLKAVHSGQVAAVLPTIALSQVDPHQVEMVPLPSLSALEREVRLIWSRKMGAVRPNLEPVAHRIAKLLEGVLQVG